MGDSFSIIDLIFFVAALVIGFRIYATLGTRTGQERKRYQETSASFKEETPPAENFGTLTESVKNFRQYDKDFHPDDFCQKAGKAMEMILTAFFAGNRQTLKTLLTKEMYQQFDTLMKTRENKKENATLPFFRLISAKIKTMSVTSKQLEVIVSFKSEQTLLVTDTKGNVLSGNENQVETIHDEWTFTRGIKSKSPTWLLAAVK